MEKRLNKGLVETFSKCPYRAWAQIRGEREKKSEKMARGEQIHKFVSIAIQKEVAKRGLTLEQSSIHKRADLSLEDIMRVHSFKKVVERIIDAEQPLLLESPIKIQVGGSEKDPIFLTVKPDFVSYMDLNGSPTIHVWEWKSGDGVVRKEDLEAMLYAYAVFLHFGRQTDVLFTRMSVSSQIQFNVRYYKEELDDIAEEIPPKLEQIANELFSDEPPEAIPGAHCATCPIIDKCPVAEMAYEATSVAQKRKVIEWANALKQKYEAELKEISKEIGSAIEDDNGEITASLNGEQVTIEKSTSVFWSPGKPEGAKKKLKKDDLLPILAERGLLNHVAGNLSIKTIDDSMAAFIEEALSIPMEKRARTVYKIK